jgi:ATP-dependent Clp protease ATP-binding subunit ClpA
VFDRFEDDAKRAMNLAVKEAQGLGHNYLGLEHILLGLLQVPACAAVRIVEGLGIDPQGIRARVLELVRPGPGPDLGQLPFTPRSKKALEISMVMAGQLGDRGIGTAHLLLGIASVWETDALEAWSGVLGTDLAHLLHAAKNMSRADGELPPADKEGTVAQKLLFAAQLCDRVKEELILNQEFERASRSRDLAHWLRELAKELEPPGEPGS